MKKLVFPAILLKNRKASLASALIFLIFLWSCKNEPADKRIKELDPDEATRIAKSIENQASPQLAEGINLKLWASDSVVADPISIDIDDLGRLYYSRTIRQKHSEFDIRGHQDWEIGSVQLKTVEEKRAFLHKVLSPELSDKNEWLADLNGDGSHDWRDMRLEKEHIYRVEDKSGNGVANFSQLIVEDFNDEVTDVAGAVLAHGDDLFVGVAPDMWRMKDKNGDGIMDEKTSISHGYGVHVGFSGHGMSGLKVGPEGKIYWGIGDIGFNGEGPDGTKYEYHDRGVIARANPDGSDFEIFAMGVRNTHEFDFDEYGNLISVDNDGDHRGEKERLVYLVNGSDTGWRINWQFGKYKDPDNNTYKVWMDEELFKPRFEGQAAYITPPIANYINGPTGLVYNPGTALGTKWKNKFFVAEFVGNPARSGVHAFSLKPKGASFELVESEMILKGILATGLDFGPDGNLYVADWINGWGTKDHGRIWKMDDESGDTYEERQLTKQLLADNFSKYKADALGKLLENSDLRVRKKAQFELAKRGSEGAEVFEKTIKQSSSQLARVNSIWGISQLAGQDINYAKVLLGLLQDKDPEICAQAAKWLGDIRYKDAGKALIPLLKDDYSRTRFFAAEALGRIAYEPATEPIIQLLIDNNDDDLYIRHAGSLALARIGKADPLIALAKHPSAALRIAAVVALRRMQHPGVAKFLNDKDEYIVTEAARAINDDASIPEALPALGNVLKDSRFTNEALLRRAINANLRVGTEEALQNLMNYALMEGSPLAMRTEAIDALSTWAKPSVLDRVDGKYRGEIERDLNQIKLATAAPFTKLLTHKEGALRLYAVKAIGRLVIDQAANQLFSMLKNDLKPEVRIAALRALVALDYEQVDKAIELAIADKAKSVRVAGLDLIEKLDISKDLMVNLLWEVIEKRTVEEKQAALLTLGNVPLENSESSFKKLLSKLETQKLPAEIHFELGEAIAQTKSTELAKDFEDITSKLSPNPLSAKYEGTLHGGDPENGKIIFLYYQHAQCIRCHSFDDMGGTAGPRLNGIASKLSRKELLEALIEPSKRLAPGFGVVTLQLEGGKSITGTLNKEDDNSLAIKVGNKPDTVILKKHVQERQNAPSSMPDMKYILSKKEIRDIISFLVVQKEDDMGSDKPLAKSAGHGSK